MNMWQIYFANTLNIKVYIKSKSSVVQRYKFLEYPITCYNSVLNICILDGSGYFDNEMRRKITCVPHVTVLTSVSLFYLR